MSKADLDKVDIAVKKTKTPTDILIKDLVKLRVEVEVWLEDIKRKEKELKEMKRNE